MPHLPSARPTALAHRRRVLAPLLGVLALALALFPTAATAGAGTHAKTGHAAKQGAGHHDPNGRAGDNAPGRDDNNRKAGADDEVQPEPACGQNSGYGNANALCPVANPQCPAADDGPGNAREAKAKGRDAKAEKAKGAKAHKDRVGNEGPGNACEPKPDCVSSGPGNPCPPTPQQCGENSGYGNANDRCAADNPECPVMNEHQGNAADDHQGDDVKGVKHEDKGRGAKEHGAKEHGAKEHGAKQHGAKHHGAKDEKARKDKANKGHKANAENDDDAQCVPPPVCDVEGKPACDENHQPVCGVAGKPACDNNHVPVCGVAGKPACDNNQVPVCGVAGKPACDNNQVPVCGVAGKPACDNNQVPVTTVNTVAGQQQAAATPAATPTATTAPQQSDVAGTQVRSASASLRTQARCGTWAFRVTVSGRNIRRVTLFVAGRRIRTITVPAGRRSITVSVPVRRFGARRQSVQARVTFRNGAAARTLTASATRCAQTAVSPQFTG
jgi:hypothetical protein